MFIAVIAAVFLGIAIRFNFWRPDVPGLPILMYHYIADELDGTSLPKLRVKPHSFKKQIEYLKNHGYQAIGFKEYHDHLANGAPLPEKPVIITFDDGEAEALRLAKDILSDYGMTAVVFAVPGLVGIDNAWDRSKNEPVVKLMDWDGLSELRRTGWEIGSHTLTHANLVEIDRDGLREEIEVSKKILEEKFDTQIVSLAYPFGAFDEQVKKTAQAAGYRFGISIRHGKNADGDDPFELKRIMVKRKDTIWDFSLKLRKGRSTF